MLAALLVLLVPAANPSAQPVRRIALTFDDLPGVSRRHSLEALDDMSTRLLATLRISKVPAIGFVNEGGLDVDGERDARIAILRQWIVAGMTLGNHTYSHTSLSRTPLAKYEADVLKGEVITRQLLAHVNQQPRWFRHPFTHTGPTLDIKMAFERFLAEHGYRVAPFTIETADYAFAAVYDDALIRVDQATADRAMTGYLDHQDRMVLWAETLSRETFGRDIPQILLSHVNRLNADAMPELLRRLRARGYVFTTMEQAMEDEAYRTPDVFVGTFGPSWLHRWRVALKLQSRLKEEPDAPAWVLTAVK